jgi:hypothetical protein
MTLSGETKDLARSLLAYEAVADGTSVPNEPIAVRVCEKLHRPLCALAGVASYRSLLARALTLAQAEAPSLRALQITENGNLRTNGELPSQSDHYRASEGDLVLTAQFLGLFLCLLGTAVTLQLVRDVFPNLTVTTESGTITPFDDILKEVGYLNSVSDRLELLANQNPSVENALMSVSGNLRNTATVLEVFAVIKSKPDEPQKKIPKQQPERYLM